MSRFIEGRIKLLPSGMGREAASQWLTRTYVPHYTTSMDTPSDHKLTSLDQHRLTCLD